MKRLNSAIEQAAKAIDEADVLLLTAGAGMGVDSGLPDFRGNEGFWRAYPKFQQLGKSFSEMANPVWFEKQPELAWGFYGHRFNLYQACMPHAGFALLKQWAERKADYFIFTSNVDGQFQKAGFSEQHILECHGSIQHFQCSKPCCDSIWQADVTEFEVDDIDMHCLSPLPLCPRCNAVARPNILMFGDGYWVANRAEQQQKRYQQFLNHHQSKKIAIIECGAGLAVPTVRFESEAIDGTLIRINPRDSEVPNHRFNNREAISLALPALAALEQIAKIIERRKL